MNAPSDYRAFLETKACAAPALGFDVDPTALNPALRPHTRLMVRWALKGGRRAWFASFGLHKTATQIEAMRLIGAATGRPTLIVLPLGVRAEFIKEARIRFTGEHAVRMRFIRTAGEVEPETIHLTNYETMRDGKLDPALFAAVSLDEAACLRGFGGSKTFREFMRLFDADSGGGRVPYRFVATATPSPNDYIELLAYAAFLGVMDVGQAKTRFFKRNSEKADTLTIHPHKEKEFWLWVASWALFVQKPSDLDPTFSDAGYDLPALDVRWHALPAEAAAVMPERDGQGRLFADAAIGVAQAARVKRESLTARVGRMLEIRAEAPAENRMIWHDLEDERRAIEAAIPNAVSVYGSQDLADREAIVADFAEGRIRDLAAKPVMLGAGTNLQGHCAWAIFLGIGFKFADFVQAVHRFRRFGQPRPSVRIDLIYSEAERDVRRSLEAKWARHEELVAKMTAIIRDYGLNDTAMTEMLTRAMGVERIEVAGEGYRCINNDCVVELPDHAENSVDLIVTSIPFGEQYEYSPNYADFGHNDDAVQFWRQMDFLIPHLLRVLKPGRNAMIHVKDRIVPGGINKLGFQTVYPFSDECIVRFRQHGFAFLARKTVTTDVVRENNQTYRLGWSEQCKDGTRMGAGMPEYGLLFRKPPSDLSDGYADAPVVKAKPDVLDLDAGPVAWGHGLTAAQRERRRPIAGTGYSRGRWQLDAHGFTRSSGNRHLTQAEMASFPAEKIYKAWKAESLSRIYDFEHHVRFAERLDAIGRLPPTFMLLPPHSWHADVWTDITRMQTVNTLQAQAGREKHLCPLQFDFADRAIVQLSQPGETVLDPFAGLMTVPLRALKLGRRGIGIEISHSYFRDGLAYLRAQAEGVPTPDMFDFLEEELEVAE